MGERPHRPPPAHATLTLSNPPKARQDVLLRNTPHPAAIMVMTAGYMCPKFVCGESSSYRLNCKSNHTRALPPLFPPWQALYGYGALTCARPLPGTGPSVQVEPAPAALGQRSPEASSSPRRPPQLIPSCQRGSAKWIGGRGEAYSHILRVLDY